MKMYKCWVPCVGTISKFNANPSVSLKVVTLWHNENSMKSVFILIFPVPSYVFHFKCLNEVSVV